MVFVAGDDVGEEGHSGGIAMWLASSATTHCEEPYPVYHSQKDLRVPRLPSDVQVYPQQPYRSSSLIVASHSRAAQPYKTVYAVPPTSSTPPSL